MTPINEQSRWRVQLGRLIGEAYARNPHVAAVLVAGSSARGNADGWSDIELMVAWHEAPAEAERRQIVESFSADFRLFPFDDAWQCWQDDLFVGRSAAETADSGVLLEIVGQLTSAVDQRLADVVERHEPDLDKQTTVHALLHGIPLHGEELIASWKARAKVYPHELALAMVRRHAQIDYFADWERFLARGRNLMLIHERFAQIERQLLLVLQAINGQYHYKLKWLDRVIDELAIAPPDLGDRLRQVMTAEVPAAAEVLRELVEEVYDLVERELPEIDVSRLRSIFRWRRHEWNSPPPVGFPSLD